jgi:hypothetical protein
LSKIDDYLADKFCFSMLSKLAGGVQEQSEQSAAMIPDLGICEGGAAAKRKLEQDTLKSGS